MEVILHDIKDSEVWAIRIKNNSKISYTLHYDREKGEGVLHTDDCLVSFDSFDALKAFCQKNQLTLGGDSVAHDFDFDFEITDSIPCKLVVEHWNLLAVMAGALGLSFEGAGKEYEKLYARLFEQSSDYENRLELEDTERARLERLFLGKAELLERFITYNE